MMKRVGQSRLRTRLDRKCYHSARNKLPPLRSEWTQIAMVAGASFASACYHVAVGRPTFMTGLGEPSTSSSHIEAARLLEVLDGAHVVGEDADALTKLISEARAGRRDAACTGLLEERRGTFSVLDRTLPFEVREPETFAGAHPSLLTRTPVQGERRFVATFRALDQQDAVVGEAGRRLLQLVEARRDEAHVFASRHEAEI